MINYISFKILIFAHIISHYNSELLSQSHYQKPESKINRKTLDSDK